MEDEDVDELKEEILKGGMRAAEDTFGLLPGKGFVIFIIKNPTGDDPKKALAMHLPPTMAVALGNALVNCAILSKDLGEEEEEEEKKEPLPLKKELLN